MAAPTLHTSQGHFHLVTLLGICGINASVSLKVQLGRLPRLDPKDQRSRLWRALPTNPLGQYLPPQPLYLVLHPPDYRQLRSELR